MSQPFIDYYKSHGISPVDQDVSDLQKHYKRREFLYRQMGIVPSSLRGRTVLEFGPGSGHNALYTYSLNPEFYLLVDGNPTGIKKTKQLLSSYFPETQRFQVHESRIQDFNSEQRFDFVICEGVIPGQLEPKSFLKHLASFVCPGGVLLISTADAVSTFSENIRNVIGALSVNPELDFNQRLQEFEVLFAPHLKSLNGMSRSTCDWVLDNILHPLKDRGNLLSIADAIDTLDQDFEIHSTSPHFITNWHWYKEVHALKDPYNGWAREAFFHNLHNLIDHRYVSAPLELTKNQRLLEICDQTRSLCTILEQNRAPDLVSQLIEQTKEVRSIIHGVLPVTGQALEELIAALQTYSTSGTLPKLVKFAQLFGRAQQYLSFIRRKS